MDLTGVSDMVRKKERDKTVRWLLTGVFVCVIIFIFCSVTLGSENSTWNPLHEIHGDFGIDNDKAKVLIEELKMVTALMAYVQHRASTFDFCIDNLAVRINALSKLTLDTRKAYDGVVMAISIFVKHHRGI